jgi:hypothetical protein
MAEPESHRSGGTRVGRAAEETHPKHLAAHLAGGDREGIMNKANDPLTVLEEKKRIAAEVCVLARCLTRCEVHGEVIDDGAGSPEQALHLAQDLIDRHDPLVAAFAGDLHELKTLITTVVEEHGPECPRCAA